MCRAGLCGELLTVSQVFTECPLWAASGQQPLHSPADLLWKALLPHQTDWGLGSGMQAPVHRGWIPAPAQAGLAPGLMLHALHSVTAAAALPLPVPPWEGRPDAALRRQQLPTKCFLEGATDRSSAEPPWHPCISVIILEAGPREGPATEPRVASEGPLSCPPGCLSGGVLQDGHLPRDAHGAPSAALDPRELAVLGLAGALPFLPVPGQHDQERVFPDAGQLHPCLLRG